MDFLKEILGDELYAQFESKINEHNGKEENKEKQLKLADLGGGEYIAKGKHEFELEKLNQMLTGKTNELEKANGLIDELKKGTKGNEDLQNKINGYETTVTELQNQLQETKIKSALKVALLSEKALDIDYLTFKVNEKLAEQGKALELDENENIKGWDEMLSGLKTQFPAQFNTEKGMQKVDPIKLPDQQKKEGFTKADLLKKPYAERQKIYNENPEAYKEVMKS